ncbi:MAG: hypothetical protein N4A74_01550 [Carboxylicivirga sp.]|jgi:hypothetical protein|nr:hypothetical protein [Carboxylicivirga sp.]
MPKVSLPKGFRFLYSKKEIREIESRLNLKFDSIIFGHITHANKFEPNSFFQSSIHPVSISAKKSNEVWLFTIHQTGIRNELIPEENETEIKKGIKKKIMEYIPKIQNSIDTDFLKQPQLWIYSRIKKGKVCIDYREIK